VGTMVPVGEASAKTVVGRAKRPTSSENPQGSVLVTHGHLSLVILLSLMGSAAVRYRTRGTSGCKGKCFLIEVGR